MLHYLYHVSSQVCDRVLCAACSAVPVMPAAKRRSRVLKHHTQLILQYHTCCQFFDHVIDSVCMEHRGGNAKVWAHGQQQSGRKCYVAAAWPMHGSIPQFLVPGGVICSAELFINTLVALLARAYSRYASQAPAANAAMSQ